MPRVLMLFNKPRAERIRAAQEGRCPDELLYGMRTLQERGWQVDATDEGFSNYPGARLLKGIDNLLSRGGRRVGFHLKQAWRLRRAIRRADVVLATADSSGLPVLLLKALGLVRTPVVYCSIGLAQTFGEPVGLVFALYRALLRRAAKILVYAKPEAEQLARLFSVPVNKVSFVPFGVETEFFASTELGCDRPLAFGIDHRRDWPTFFNAAASFDGSLDLLTNPDLLRGLALPRNVAVSAPVPIDILRDRIRQAPFVVLPVRDNDYTGATISLLEAMAAGRATIVSRTKAIEQGYGLVDGENCLLVPPEDVPALARAMTRLAAEPELAERIGRSAAEHVRENLHVRRMAETFDRALREALA